MQELLVVVALGFCAAIPLRAIADDGTSSNRPQRLTEAQLDEVTAGGTLAVVIPSGPGPHFLSRPHDSIQPPIASPAAVSPMVKDIQLTFDGGPVSTLMVLQLPSHLLTRATTALPSGG